MVVESFATAIQETPYLILVVTHTGNHRWFRAQHTYIDKLATSPAFRYFGFLSILHFGTTNISSRVSKHGSLLHRASREVMNTGTFSAIRIYPQHVH
jgi:hypothetical protein